MDARMYRVMFSSSEFHLQVFTWRVLAVLMLFAFVLPVPNSLAAQEYVFEDLGPGIAVDINENGEVLVTPAYGTTVGPHLISAIGARRELPNPTVFSLSLSALNARGHVAGWVLGSSGLKAAVWDSAGAAKIFAGSGDMMGLDINDAGAIVLLRTSSAPQGLFLVEGGTERELAGGYRYVTSVAMKDAGAPWVVGAFSDGSSAGQRPVSWSDPRRPVQMGYVAGLREKTVPTTVNKLGMTVGYVGSQDSLNPFTEVTADALLWHEPSLKPEYLLPGQKSIAYDVSDDGFIVGAARVQNVNRAYVWRPDRSGYDLNSVLPEAEKNRGWVLSVARATNYAGEIVGGGILSGGVRAFRLRPTTAPRKSDLSVDVAGLTAPGRVGAEQPIEFAVKNAGSSEIDATLELSGSPYLPIELPNTQDCKMASRSRFLCGLRGLAAGETRRLTITAKYLNFGQFDWRANVAASIGEATPEDNTQVGSLSIVRAQTDSSAKYFIHDLGPVHPAAAVLPQISNRGDILIAETGVSSPGQFIRAGRNYPVGGAPNLALGSGGLIAMGGNGTLSASKLTWDTVSPVSDLTQVGASVKPKGVDNRGNVWAVVSDAAALKRVVVMAPDKNLTDISSPTDLSWFEPTGVNGAGTAAGYGWKKNGGGYLPLGMRAGAAPWRLRIDGWPGGKALAIASDGKMAGFVGSDASPRAAVWLDANTMLDIGQWAGSNSIALGINAKGAAVGAARNGTSSQFAFLVQYETMLDLNTAVAQDVGVTWVLKSATGINDVGDIVGMGVRNGESRAFMLRPNTASQLVVAPTSSPVSAPERGVAFGSRIAVDGNYMAVGDPADTSQGIAAGSVVVYQRSGDDWSRLRAMYPPNTDTSFGASLALKGSLLAVSARSYSYVSRDFSDPQRMWSAYAHGSLIPAVSSDGVNVANANLAVLDSSGQDFVLRSPGLGALDNVVFRGQTEALIHSRVDSYWQRVSLFSYTSLSPTTNPALFAEEKGTGPTVLQASQSRVALGLPNDNRLFLYRHENGEWIPEDTLSPPEGLTGSFGAAIALTDDILLVGAPDSGYASRASGVVYVYQRHGRAWVLETRIGAADAPIGAQFGAAVGLREFGDGLEVVVGAPGWASGDVTTGTGRVLTYRLDRKLPVVDVSLTTRIAPQHANVNDVVTFSFDLSNGSTGNTAHDVVVRCVPPPGQTATLVWKETSAQGELPEITVPVLAPTATESLICKTTLAAVGAYALRMYATLAKNEEDPDSADNAVSVPFKVELPKIELALEKTGATSPVYIGREAAFSFAVTNGRQQFAAHGVELSCVTAGDAVLKMEGPSERISIDGAYGHIATLEPGARVDLRCVTTQTRPRQIDVLVEVTWQQTESDIDANNNRIEHRLEIVAPGNLVLAIVGDQRRSIDKGSAAEIEYALSGGRFRATAEPILTVDGRAQPGAQVRQNQASIGTGAIVFDTAGLPRGDRMINVAWDVVDEAGDARQASASLTLNVRRAVAHFGSDLPSDYDFGSEIEIPVTLDHDQGAGRLGDYRWSLRKIDQTQVAVKGRLDSGIIKISSGSLEVGDYELVIFYDGEDAFPDGTMNIKFNSVGPGTRVPESTSSPDSTQSAGALDWPIVLMSIIVVAHRRRKRHWVLTRSCRSPFRPKAR